MLRLILPIAALLLGVALLLLGTGLLNTVVAVRGGLEGYSDGLIGIIMSGYFVGFFIGTFIAMPLIRRVGHIRAFALCAALASASALAYVLVIHPVVWGLLRVMTGVVLVILYTISESWLNAQTPAAQRGRVFAIYMAVNLGSLAAAQQLLRLDATTSYLLFIIAGMLISVSLVPVAWTRMAQPAVHDAQRLRLRRLWSLAPLAVAASFLSGLAMGAFWGLGALYAGRIGLDASGIATFMTAAILGGAVLQLPLGRLSDSFDRRLVLSAASIAAAVGGVLLLALSGSERWVTIAIALYGGMAFAIYPVAIAHLVDHLSADDVLSGCSSLLLLHGVGAAIGPALAGQIMEWTHLQALPLYFAATHALLAAYAIRRLLRNRHDAEDHSSVFVPLVRTTPMAMEMHLASATADEGSHENTATESHAPPDTDATPGRASDGPVNDQPSPAGHP
ncbi:MFS transporter [Algiphilus sp.]|uniref:MFS transporter n=1 Tax=Algiphilus sp. TaxID=1872431 RepID=UPI003B52CFF0